MRPGLVIALVLAACGSKAPAGFTSSGSTEDRWTLPLVGALEDGLLLTPVTLGTYGPVLFALDPDAPISAIDGELVKRLGMRATAGPQVTGENGNAEPRAYVELVGLELGTLIIERRRAIVVRPHTFDTAGRRVHGVLGADVLGTVVFGFDRDLGIATLVEPGAFTPPSGAIALPYQVVGKALPVVGRRVVKATIGEETFNVHVDLGAVASSLREAAWPRAKLVVRELAGAVADETGALRRIDRASEPIAVKLGAVANDKVVFVPYGDRRWAEHEVAGTLGLGFFAHHDVWVHFAAKTLYVLPREALPLAKRIGRWETGGLDTCTISGCATVRLIDPLAGKPREDGKPRPGVILSLTREERVGGMPLEIVLAPSRADLPLVIANLPAHVDRLIDQLPPAFVGATLTVVDTSPYPRECPTKNGCVDKLTR